MAGDAAFIEFQELSKIFYDHRHHATPVVEPLSLTIAEGEFVVFVGPSGCGKTTVMRMAGGLETPTTGGVLIKGQEVDGPSREKGMVFQSYSSFPWLTVLGNVRFGLKYRNDLPDQRKRTGSPAIMSISSASRRFRIFTSIEFLAACGSAWRLHGRLAADPLVLLMDEPFGALDALTRERLQLQLLQLRNAERKTVIFVTHDVDEAVFLSDRIVVFSARPARVLRDVRVSAELPRERSDGNCRDSGVPQTSPRGPRPDPR